MSIVQTIEEFSPKQIICLIGIGLASIVLVADIAIIVIVGQLASE